MKSSLLRAILKKSCLHTGLAATLLSISGLVAAAQSTPFNYAYVETFAGDSTDGSTDMFSASTPVFAERGAAPEAYGKARAQFGSNGFAVLSGAAGSSAWSDGFLVTSGSGSGSGLINLSVNIHGTVVGTEADMSYTLFASANPFDLQTIFDSYEINNENPQVPGAVSILHTEVKDGVGSSNITLLGTMSFIYGQQFYLASVLVGDVCTATTKPQCTGGSEDFFNSANFGITGPSGATLAALSETTYAAAVPVPAAVWLFGSGLIGLTGLARKRKTA